MPGETVLNPILIPSWMIKVAVGALIVLTVGAGGTWLSHTTVETTQHDKDIALLKDHQDTMQKDIDEMKLGQKEVLVKLDLVINRNLWVDSGAGNRNTRQ